LKQSWIGNRAIAGDVGYAGSRTRMPALVIAK
jgi:hypothetical protein